MEIASLPARNVAYSSLILQEVGLDTSQVPNRDPTKKKEYLELLLPNTCEVRLETG